MNLLKDIAKRNLTLAKRELPSRLRKFSSSLGDRLAIGGGEFQSADTRRMSATFVISTSSVDRDGDVMVPSGCNLDAYRKNPIVLWDHQSDQNPIGIAEDGGQLHVTIQSNRITSTCFFHCKTERSAETYALVADGIIRGASIGFLPLPGGAKKNGKGYLFDGWELTEWSITPLGANSEALRHRLDTGKVKSLKSILEPYAAKSKKNWSNGVTLEKAMLDEKEDDEKDTEEEDPVDDIEKEEDLLDDDAPEDDDDELDNLGAEEATGDPAPEAEDFSQKPAARGLGEVAAAYAMLAERLAQLVATNDHPKAVDKFSKLLEHAQAIADECKADIAAMFPGLDPESVMPNVTDEVPPEEPAPETPPENELPDEEMTKGKRLKRLNKAHSACVKEASEFLSDLGDDAQIPSRLKGGCRYHAKALGDVLAGQEKPEEASEDEADLPEEAKKHLERIAKRLKV